MQKGKFGICLWFYAVVGFIFAIMNQTSLCLLLLGFVIAAEQNQWATKQVMQALFLCLTRALVTLIPAAIHSVTSAFPVFGGLLSALFYVFNVLVFFGVLVFAIIGIVNAVRGSESGVPLFSKLANRAFGAVEKKTFYQPPEEK